MSIASQLQNYELFNYYKKLKEAHTNSKASANVLIKITNELKALPSYDSVSSTNEKTFVNNLQTLVQNYIDNLPSIPDL